MVRSLAIYRCVCRWPRLSSPVSDRGASALLTMDDRESDLWTPSLSGWQPTGTDPPAFSAHLAVLARLLRWSGRGNGHRCPDAPRLQLPKTVQRRMVVGGILVTLLEFAILWAAIVGFGLDPDRGARARLLPRWSFTLINLLWAAVLVRWQTPGARWYESFGGGGYASMWGPGFVAALASAVVLIPPFFWFLWVTGGSHDSVDRVIRDDLGIRCPEAIGWAARGRRRARRAGGTRDVSRRGPLERSALLAAHGPRSSCTRRLPRGHRGGKLGALS